MTQSLLWFSKVCCVTQSRRADFNILPQEPPLGRADASRRTSWGDGGFWVFLLLEIIGSLIRLQLTLLLKEINLLVLFKYKSVLCVFFIYQESLRESIKNRLNKRNYHWHWFLVKILSIPIPCPYGFITKHNAIKF